MAQRLAICASVGVTAAAVYAIAEALGLIKVPLLGVPGDLALAAVGTALATYLALFGPLRHED